MKPVSVDRDPRVTAHVNDAMAHVEKAQNELGLACAALSNVVGMQGAWEAVSREIVRVRRLWGTLEERRATARGLMLDSAHATQGRCDHCGDEGGAK